MPRPLVILLLAFSVCVAHLRAADPRLPSHDEAIAALKGSFIEAPRQIPATVVDVGVLKFIPYLSYRVSEDRELNVYGDPAAPACVELGLYGKFLSSNREKERCILYLQGIFPFVEMRGLRLDGGKSMRGSVVVEITPPDEPDAYGGWWISVYSLPLLSAARGTSTNVHAFSVPKESAVAAEEWTEPEMKYARPTPASGGEPKPAAISPAPVASRPSSASAVSSSRTSSAPPSSAGRVYVRGYTRKDGTYVRSHTRKR